MRAAIIGGGVTGLSIAYELAKKGHRPTVFERDARIGGLAGSFRVGDTWLEKFYHHIFKSDTAVLGWIDELGLRDRLIWRTSPMGFFHRGRIHRFGTPLELLRFSPLSLVERIKLGFAVLHFQRMEDWSELDTVTCKQWYSNT
jgi:protoporphyrinogen oxidase